MKPVASLSLDLDNIWSYLKTHGDSGWESYPSYFETVVPRILDFFNARRLKITFFVVGQDLLNGRSRDAVCSVAAAGHELANHSYSHEPWMHLESDQRIDDEIASTEALIESIAGLRPIGFRGPGYCFSATTIRVLKNRGYLYDASSFPTWIGPLARAYYFVSTHFNPDQKKQRHELFGGFRNALRGLKAHNLRGLGGDLLEIPVTTMPIARVPMHVSYILYLATFSRNLAIRYFCFSLWLCRVCRVEPSLLLHPPDFLGYEDAPELAFFPAMRMDATQKTALVSELLDIYCSRFSVLTMKEHARLILESASRAAEFPESSVV